MSGNRARRFRISADVVTRDMPDGQLVLVNVESGATWSLDEIGAEVCRRLDGVVDVHAICTSLEALYEVETDVLSRDIDALLEELQSAGLIIEAK